LICAGRHESDHVPIELEALDIVEQGKILRDLPVYCERASLRAAQDHPERKDIIRDFRIGKSKQDLKAMETVVGIILDSASYKKKPFSEQKLANILSEFLWHFKEHLDFQMWKLLDHTFEMHFFIPKNDVPFVSNYMASFVERLAKRDGHIPFFPLDTTHQCIRKKLLASSKVQQGTVRLRRDILEDNLRQEYALVQGEYIPVVESLFLAFQNHSLPLLDVSAGSMSFEAMKLPEEQEIRYDDNAKRLHIREHAVSVAKSVKEQHLLFILMKEQEKIGKKWLIDEILEDIDHVQPTEKRRKYYENAVDTLNGRVALQTGIRDFVIRDKESVQMNPSYLS
jgi:hypothetical protein